MERFHSCQKKLMWQVRLRQCSKRGGQENDRGGTLSVQHFTTGKPHHCRGKIYFLCGKSGLALDFLLHQGTTVERSQESQSVNVLPVHRPAIESVFMYWKSHEGCDEPSILCKTKQTFSCRCLGHTWLSAMWKNWASPEVLRPSHRGVHWNEC